MTHPNLVLGGAALGSSYQTLDAVSELLVALKKHNISHIDSAARYPPTNPGRSEQLLGQAKAAEAGFIIDTKINTEGDGSGTLTPAAIETSLRSSFDRLQVKNVNVLYCHKPDPETPLVVQAAALNYQYNRGRFTTLGVSNFSPALLEEFIQICKDRNFVKPHVYQGQYNVVCRRIETTLFPVLRAHGMVFAAFSPLAGGFLSGKLTSGSTEGTRFGGGNIMGAFFEAQYDKPSMHAAIKKLEKTIQPLGISGTETALRWICFHSALEEADSVILGSSRIEQIEENVNDIAKGPLPQSVVDALQSLWDSVKDDAP